MHLSNFGIITWETDLSLLKSLLCSLLFFWDSLLLVFPILATCSLVVAKELDHWANQPALFFLKEGSHRMRPKGSLVKFLWNNHLCECERVEEIKKKKLRNNYYSLIDKRVCPVPSYFIKMSKYLVLTGNYSLSPLIENHQQSFYLAFCQWFPLINVRSLVIVVSHRFRLKLFCYDKTAECLSFCHI